MHKEFWKNKTVFVTGHTGFKGSWLCLWLQKLQARVIGYSLPPPTPVNMYSLARIGEEMESVEGDIRNFKHLQETLTQHQPDIVFHLAAQPLVRASYQFPIETYSTNVMGTVHLLEAARSLENCRAIVNITTDKCYENREWHWAYRENDPLGGYDPYSNSKACAELVSMAFRNSYYSSIENCGLATTRAGNVIGGGDWAEDRLIPDIIRGISNNREIELRYPQALRPWQHVLEPLHGYLKLAESLYHYPDRFAEAWNFGPEEADAKPVQWLVSRILELWDYPIPWRNTGKNNVHEATYLKLDSSKAKQCLFWKPQWNLDKALEETVNWYKAFTNHDDLKAISLSQIDQYSINLQDN